VTLAYLKGKDAESQEAQEHAGRQDRKVRITGTRPCGDDRHVTASYGGDANYSGSTGNVRVEIGQDWTDVFNKVAQPICCTYAFASEPRGNVRSLPLSNLLSCIEAMPPLGAPRC
jgi:hypothetical protein